MSPASILSCSHLHKTFQRSLIPVRQLQERLVRWPCRREHWSVVAVDDVSLDLAPGEWVGLYGPNGCGKTTLLKLLSGVLRSDRGTVRRNGNISCFFDLGIGFHDERVAEENVRMYGLLQGIGARSMEYVLREARSFAGIGDHWRLPCKCYSTGMRLRLAFAVAMVVPADVLLIDEVFAVGDSVFRQQCWDRLHQLRTEGRSAIMVSHDIRDLEHICHRILFMERGQVVREHRQVTVQPTPLQTPAIAP